MPVPSGPFDHPNELEVALIAAAKDPVARGPFYRILLDSTVYVVGGVGRDKPAGPTTFEVGETLALRNGTLPDGRSCIPFYSSLDWLSVLLTEPAPCLALPVRSLFENTPGATLVLNLGSPWGKEFTPEEVKHLLDHGSASKEIGGSAPRRMTLGLPTVEPTALLAALTTVLKSHPEVSGAYLAWVDFPDEASAPHALIGLDGDGDLREARQDVGATANGIGGADALVDIVGITRGVGGPSEFLVEKGIRFYER
jgi:hypothetical protein